MPELPERPRRQDRHQGRPQRLDPGQRNRTGQDEWMQTLMPADQLRKRSISKYEGTQFRESSPDQPLLLLDEQRRSRPSTTSRCARRSTTRSSRQRWNGSTPARSKRSPDPPRGHAGPRGTRPLPAQHGEGEGADRGSQPLGPRHHGLDRQRKPQEEAGAYYQDVLEETRLQRQAENRSTPTTTSRSSATNRRPTSTPAGSTSTRTTRTRTTSSSRCWPAKASCRPTTRTSPTSTTRS